jgi:hypothetical protein
MGGPTASGGLRNRLTCLNIHKNDDDDDDDESFICILSPGSNVLMYSSYKCMQQNAPTLNSLL